MNRIRRCCKGSRLPSSNHRTGRTKIRSESSLSLRSGTAPRRSCSAKAGRMAFYVIAGLALTLAVLMVIVIVYASALPGP